ncbi:MAG: C cytochrome precursor [Planctomycetes bacterium]|nr:C cytochrome precursor [Planctomycetota bacterium]
MLPFLTALLAALAVAPLWRLPAGAGGRRLCRVAAGAAALAAAVAAFAFAPAPASPPSTRPLEVRGHGYVGSASCRACHPDQHASWQASFHRTMTRVDVRAALVPRFDRLQLDWFGAPVLLEWRGDRLWTRFERRGRSPAAVERPIEQITGSHHLQVLWYSTGKGRELAPVPLCYHLEEGLWLPLTAAFVLPPDHQDPPEPGAWSQSCHACHATNARPRFDADHNDTEVSEFGIACEACHGPGAAHAAANREPLARFQRRRQGHDDSIVDPAALPPARSAQVCGQCHAVAVVRQEHAEAWREHGSPYRPGLDLDASHLIVGREQRDAPEVRRELRHNPEFFASSFWSDGEVRLSGREYNGLRRSPCYTHGDRTRQLDCTTCHRMHPEAAADLATWRDDQLGAGMRGNAACTQCHGALAEPAALAAHTRHAPDSPGSLCYDCHMPHTSFGLMKASRSHTITSPSVQAELATGRPNACNQCHLDRSLRWTDAALRANWGLVPATLPEDDADVAAAVRWLLAGDAGQRTLAAWSLGWAPARAAAGTDWMAPYLARLLDDPYYAVRFQAARSLRSLGGAVAEALAGYDFLAPEAAARPVGERVAAAWRQHYQGPPRPALLLDADGLQAAAFARQFARRDDRRVYLAE